jgi:RimJ/RimL family protein N-acetyltransferase
MVERAFSEAEVERVVAHTLPEGNASTAVLRRLGFVQAETVEDPEDGTVWRWVLERPGGV